MMDVLLQFAMEHALPYIADWAAIVTGLAMAVTFALNIIRFVIDSFI